MKGKGYDFSDITFLFKIRIDSAERSGNINAVLRFIDKNFKAAGIIILEADSERRFSPNADYSKLSHVFIEDNNPVFRLSYWTNRVIEMAKTPFVAVWDSDIICPPGQVVDAIGKLREERAVMTIPYDGRCYSCDSQTSSLFKETRSIDILENHYPPLQLTFGYHNVGGAFLVNREMYLGAGGDNESIYGWGLEDEERVKRMEVLGYPVYRAKGAMYHLWHPRGKNSWFADDETRRRSLLEFSKTCAMKKDIPNKGEDRINR